MEFSDGLGERHGLIAALSKEKALIALGQFGGIGSHEPQHLLLQLRIDLIRNFVTTSGSSMSKSKTFTSLCSIEKIVTCNSRDSSTAFTRCSPVCAASLRGLPQPWRLGSSFLLAGANARSRRAEAGEDGPRVPQKSVGMRATWGSFSTRLSQSLIKAGSSRSRISDTLSMFTVGLFIAPPRKSTRATDEAG
jgi:hypothetical protein